MKKYLVLGVLFLLPISVYMFFATGVNNFVNLPVVSHNVKELSTFSALGEDTIYLNDRITVLLFFGNDVASKKANAFNLAHKIYKKNYQFKEFQFVTLITEDQIPLANELLDQLNEIENSENWKFAIGESQDIEDVFRSLNSFSNLDNKLSTNTVFIIDKERNLRGRTEDEDYGKMYGYDAANYAEINNKMSDDIKVVLAEYRLALKKYKADREI